MLVKPKNMKLNKNTPPYYRNSNIELLRIGLMFLICIHHYIVHGLGLKYMGTDNITLPMGHWQVGTFTLLNVLCICAVNCFVLISGYYGIRLKRSKFVGFLFMVEFFVAGRWIVSALVGRSHPDWKSLVLFLSHSDYWFIEYYVLLMLFAPMFNNAFERMSRRYLNIMISGFLILSCYLGFLWQDGVNVTGYTLLQFFTMYVIGRWIKQNQVEISYRWCISGYLLSSILVTTIMVFLYYHGHGHGAWRLTNYNNPLIMLNAILLFMMFKKLNFHSKTINWLAGSAFAIYLVQSASIFDRFQYPFVANMYLQYGMGVIVVMIVMALGMMSFAVIANQLQIRISAYAVPRILNLLDSICSFTKNTRVWKTIVKRI